MVLVHGERSRRLIEEAETFLQHMQEWRFETIWDDMMTYQAKDLVSHSVMPIYLLEIGEVDTLLDINQIRAVAFAFQMDHEEMRTGFFQSFAEPFAGNGWFKLDRTDWMAFATDDAALAINGSRDKALIVPFVRLPTGEYVIDWEAYLVFSMAVSSSKLFEIGTRALVYGHQATADLFFGYSAKLARPLERLKQLVLDHVLVQNYITDHRKEELRAQRAHSERAEEQISPQTRSTGVSRAPLNISKFLDQHFKRYAESADVTITETDLQTLDLMSDTKLRKAVAEVLLGVDKHQARREAGKSHGPAELADMVVDVTFDGVVYSLCMPFKTGREMKKQPTVPESVVYQVWRPLMFLANSVVVFITARPCSQFLWQDIRQSRGRLGWPITVIEHEALACLLKANGRL